MHQAPAQIATEMKAEYCGVECWNAPDSKTGWTRIESPQEANVEVGPAGALDCSTLRFDGLYQCNTGSLESPFLRFYPNGVCVGVTAHGTPTDVAKWLKAGARYTDGRYTRTGSKVIGELIQQGNEKRGVPAVTYKMKGQRTKKGFKVTWWSSSGSL